MNKKTITAISAAGAAASPAAAAIHHTELPEPISTTGSGSSIYFHLSEGWASTQAPAGSEDFRLHFADSNADKPRITGNTNERRIFETQNYAWRTKNFAAGTPIDMPYATRYGEINHNGTNDSEWAAGTRGYLGLILGDFSAELNYGWAEVEYRSDKSLALYGFAYDDSGEHLEAGAIPEPKTTALLAALAAGSAAVFARRRKAVSANV